jgi:hypothetical protein
VRSLSHQRCFNHSLREAAARCPECKQFYCRECITEHDSRVICATCLKKVSRKPVEQRRSFVGLVRGAQFLFGFALALLFFYMLGQSLLLMPSSFHNGTIWKPNWEADQ